jgi:competence protein ComEA helix-hairpin-helix repeat region
VTPDADAHPRGAADASDEGDDRTRRNDAVVLPGDGIDGLSPSSRTLPRAARLRIGAGAAIVLLLLALGVAVAVTMFAPHGGSSTVPAVSANTKQGEEGAGGVGAAATAAPAFVHVLGAVRHPGLYQLATGARVVDAIAAAGGFAANAEQGGVNLARVIADGEQLVVPVTGQGAPAGPAAGAGGAGAPPGASGGSGGPGAKVNLNTATETELETLPRIGPALAARIIDWRTKNGRFATVQDLSNVTGIGEKTFDGLKDLVTV